MPPVGAAFISAKSLSESSGRKSGDRDGRYPFVHLVERASSPYPARNAFLEQIMTKASSRPALKDSVPHLSESRKAPLDINDFRSRTAYGGDGIRIDLANAVYAFAHGASEEDVRSAIASRDLSRRDLSRGKAPT